MSGCQDGYPLEPTHCDHFCRAIERSECGQDPVNCVLACEQEELVAASGCDTEFSAVISCLDALPANELPCSPNSFYRCIPQAASLQACRVSAAPAAP